MAIFRKQLDQATRHIEDLEQCAALGEGAGSFTAQRAAADFNLSIPKSWELAGCKKTCPLFCKCLPDAFQAEKEERHALFMRYFDAKSALAKNASSHREQLGLGICDGRAKSAPCKVVRKARSKVDNYPEEEQLSMAI